MKEASRKKIYILVLFLAIALAFSGCGRKSGNEIEKLGNSEIEGKNGNATSTDDTATTTDNTAGDTATTTDEIDTADWKVYRNEEYGFELRYPKEWKAEEDKELHKGEIQNVIIIYNQKGYDYDAVELLIQKENSYTDKVPDLPSVVPLDNIFIGEYKTSVAYKEHNMEQWFYRFFIKAKNENLQFRFVPSEYSSKEVLYKILDTVKFVE